MLRKGLKLVVVTLGLILSDAYAQPKNGFDLSNASIPVAEIYRGGPPRDGIAALTNPEFETAAQTRTKDDDRVLGVTIAGIAKAYPIKMLDLHEVVNDATGVQYFVVTWCPLCGSGVVFATNVGNSENLNFGVSGLLYNSDVLLYDRNSESLWSQLTASAISGPLLGETLPQLPAWHTTWGKWLSSHPDSLIMKGAKGYARHYRSDRYASYRRTGRLMFPVNQDVPELYESKEYVLGIQADGVSKAYPFVELEMLGKTEFTDKVGNTEFTIHWDSDAWSAHASDASGQLLPATSAFWFAWYAFHPDTEVFTAAPRAEQ